MLPQRRVTLLVRSSAPSPPIRSRIRLVRSVDVGVAELKILTAGTVLLFHYSPCHGVREENKSMRSLSIATAALIAAACHNSPTAPDTLVGVWGGQHASLTVTESGGALEFDCAHGEITTRLVPERSGRFSAPGYYVAEGGPTGDKPEIRQPTVYSGEVSGVTLTFRFTVQNQQLGPFTVGRTVLLTSRSAADLLSRQRTGTCLHGYRCI
jgi:hypothetical protein